MSNATFCLPAQFYESNDVRRYAAVPAFVNAGNLLAGAAILWRGEYGAGRHAAHYLQLKAGVAYATASELRAVALRAAGDNDAQLCSFIDTSTYRAVSEDVCQNRQQKSPYAARILMTAAMHELVRAVDIMRAHDIRYRDHHLSQWEDHLEQLSEMRICHALPSIDDGFLQALVRYGAWRENYGLCNTLGQMLLYRDTIQSDDRPHRARSHAWYAAGSDFAERSVVDYHQFAAMPSSEHPLAEPLEAVRNGVMHYNAMDSSVYFTEERLLEYEAIVTALINMQLSAAGMTDRKWSLPDVTLEE